MLKKFALVACIVLGLTTTKGVRAQSLFYNNATDSNFFEPVGAEIAAPIAFSGSYDVSRFGFKYNLPQNNTDGPTTDAIIRFYEPGSDGDAFGGKLIAAFDEHDLNVGSMTVTQDLLPFGDNFQWNAKPLDTGETGGWASLEFTNPSAGWEAATGISQDDVFQEMTTGDFFNFNGNPQAAFYFQLSGTPIVAAVPEPGAMALLTGVLAPGGVIFLLRRKGLR